MAVLAYFLGPLSLATGAAAALAVWPARDPLVAKPRWVPVGITWAVGVVVAPATGVYFGITGTAAPLSSMAMSTALALAVLGGPVAAFACAVQGRRPWAGLALTTAATALAWAVHFVS